MRVLYVGQTSGGRGIEALAKRMVESTSGEISWKVDPAPGGRTTWADFDAAVCMSDTDVDRIRKEAPRLPILWIMCVQPRFAGRLPFAIGAATRILAVSNSVKVAFPKSCQEKVFILENAVPEGFSPGPKDPKLKKDFPVLLYVGRVDSVKGGDILVEAAEEMPCQTWVVGSVGLRRVPENSRKLTFWGHRPDVLKFYRSADAFVLPSRTEGMSLALLEAMAVGLPCMASDIPPNRETLAGSGILFDLSAKSLVEAAKTLFGSEELRRELSEKALVAAAPRALKSWAVRFVQELKETIACS
jgi:glycosyltransferase involved in cell wall biosynthesis